MRAATWILLCFIALFFVFDNCLQVEGKSF